MKKHQKQSPLKRTRPAGPEEGSLHQEGDSQDSDKAVEREGQKEIVQAAVCYSTNHYVTSSPTVASCPNRGDSLRPQLGR